MELTQDLIFEIARCCTLGNDFLETVRHDLKYSFFKKEPFKKLFKAIFDYYDNRASHPTIGILAQEFSGDEEMSALLDKVRSADVVDKKKDILIGFEEFVRRSMYYQVLVESQELFNSGKRDKAISYLAAEAPKIEQFSLQRKMHSEIFSGFDQRQKRRKERDYSSTKIPTGIPPFDHHTLGGIDLGSSLLIIARSGVGKSTALRWIGFNAALRGFNVVHFQAEGTREEVEDYYDSIWTGIQYHDLKKGDLDNAKLKIIEKARDQYVSQCGKIFVVAYEQFDTASILDCRSEIKLLLKEHDIHLGIFDYIDEFEPGDGKKYSTSQDGIKARKKAVAKKIVNIANEFKMGTVAATQSNDVPYKEWNKPDFYLTRNNISNDKETVQPFSYTVTLNQTEDEADENVIKIWEDKLRHHKIPRKDRLYKLFQAPKVGRFVDLKMTHITFWDPVNKRFREPGRG